MLRVRSHIRCSALVKTHEIQRNVRAKRGAVWAGMATITSVAGLKSYGHFFLTTAVPVIAERKFC